MDLAIQPRDSDLIVATHGRALWIVDDISPLRGLGAKGLEDKLRLFPVADAGQYWQPAEDGGFGFGASEFRGASRPYGAAITFVANGDELPIADRDRDRERLVAERKVEAEKAPGREKSVTASDVEKAAAEKKEADTRESDRKEAAKATVEIRDAAGERVRRLKVDSKRGLNRVYWDLSRDSFKRPPSSTPEEPGFNPSGPQVPPGRYEVVLTLAGEERRTFVNVLADPSSGNSPEDWQARWQAILEAGSLNDAAVSAIERIGATRRDLDAVGERIRLANVEALRNETVKEDALPLAKEGRTVREGLEKLETRFWWPHETVGITPDIDVLSRLAYVRGYLGSSWSRPSANHLEYLRQARQQLEAALSDLNAFYAKEVEAYRTSLAAQKVELVPAVAPLVVR
jgi:hypothetical protein